MYFICPICNKEFNKEDKTVSHFLSCWKEHYPCHKSKSVQRTEKETRETNEGIEKFFNSFKGC